MNGMFNLLTARENEINKQIQFFSSEWEELICVDGVGGASAPREQSNSRNQNDFDLLIAVPLVVFAASINQRLIGAGQHASCAQSTNTIQSKTLIDWFGLLAALLRLSPQ